MTIDESVTSVKVVGIQPDDIVLFTTTHDITQELVEAYAYCLSQHGIANRFLVLPDESDIMSLSEERMAMWGWIRLARMKAIIENMPSREILYKSDAQYLGAGS